MLRSDFTLRNLINPSALITDSGVGKRLLGRGVLSEMELVLDTFIKEERSNFGSVYSRSETITVVSVIIMHELL